MTSPPGSNPTSHATSFNQSFDKPRLSPPSQTHNEELFADLELGGDYQVRTVLTIIKETNEKLKISLILPKIFENPKTLHKHVKGTAYEDCLAVVMEHREKRKHSPLGPPTVLHYSLIKCVDYFLENYQILQVLPNWLDDIDNEENTILESFEQLSKLAKEHFTKNAMIELAKEKHLHEIYLANERVKENIKDLMLHIQNRKINNIWKFAAKTGVIKALEDELALRQYDTDMCVSQEINKSNREIQKLSAAFAVKQNELNDEFENVRLKYENDLKMNLKLEKIARDEKNKYQLQLQALIKKYDQTMLDKYKEEQHLNEEYDKLQIEFDEFMLDYNRVHALYDMQVRQKEEEYKRQHEADVRKFSHNLAARRIQRWWKRRMRKEKKERRPMAKTKGKDGKGVVAGVDFKGKDNKGKMKRSSKTKAEVKGEKK